MCTSHRREPHRRRGRVCNFSPRGSKRRDFLLCSCGVRVCSGLGFGRCVFHGTGRHFPGTFCALERTLICLGGEGKGGLEDGRGTGRGLTGALLSVSALVSVLGVSGLGRGTADQRHSRRASEWIIYTPVKNPASLSTHAPKKTAPPVVINRHVRQRPGCSCRRNRHCLQRGGYTPPVHRLCLYLSGRFPCTSLQTTRKLSIH